MPLTKAERDQLWQMRCNLQEAFRTLSTGNNVGNGGTSAAATIIATTGEKVAEADLKPQWNGTDYELSSKVEQLNMHVLSNGTYSVHFRLPRFNGQVAIPMEKAPTHRLDDDEKRLLVASLRDLVGQSVRQLRGRAILELLEQDWEIPTQAQTHSKVELWQRLERAALRLMTEADQQRK